MNVIAELGKHYHITKIQIRLIFMEMKKHAFDDTFVMDRRQQEMLFVEMAVRILNVTEGMVCELLSCRDWEDGAGKRSTIHA